MDNAKIRTVDDVIHYLVQSKKEMREEIKKDFYKPEFQKAIKELRLLKNK